MGSGSSPGSKRNVVLYPLFHAPDFLDQVGEVAAVLHEVDVRAVDHEKWGLCIMMKEGPESFRQALQVLRGDAALEVPVTLTNSSEEHIGPGFEVDDQVGPGNLRVEELEDLTIEGQLVRIERDPGEDAVLGEQVVPPPAGGIDAVLLELALLPVALEGEEERGLKGMAFGVFVELTQKRVVFDSLEDQLRPEFRGKPPSEGRLSDADGPLDRDVAPQPSVRRHPRLPDVPASTAGSAVPPELRSWVTHCYTT